MTTATSIRLLYVGRSQKMAQVIEDVLRSEHDQVAIEGKPWSDLHIVCVSNQKSAAEEVRMAPPHGMLVEIDQGRYNRIRFCQIVRSRLPQMVIVAVHKEHDLIDGFEFDGSILRPFDYEQAREAVALLLGGVRQMYLEVGDIYLDVAMRIVDGPLGQHHLPPKLCKLLQVLMERPGAIVRREELMQQVWDTKFLGDTRTLDVHVRWLREKIEEDPSNPLRLVTVRGMGYRLNRKRDNGMTG